MWNDNYNSYRLPAESASKGSQWYQQGNSTIRSNHRSQADRGCHPGSLGMHPDQRQHSTGSSASASTAVSVHSYASNSSTHSRLTAKFPIPRLVTSDHLRGRSTAADIGTPSTLLLAGSDSAQVRADVASRIAQHEATERKARWTRAKWLLLLSVTTASFVLVKAESRIVAMADRHVQLLIYGMAGLLAALLTWFRSMLRSRGSSWERPHY